MVSGTAKDATESGIAQHGNHGIDVRAERRLALEVRARRYAFAVLQGSVVIDFGVHENTVGQRSARGSVRKIRWLLKVYTPSIVMMRRIRRARDESSKKAARSLCRIRKELKRQSVRLVMVTREDVRKFFARHGGTTKHEMALLLTKWHKELRTMMPSKRAPWDAEAYTVVIFDAVATARTVIGVPCSKNIAP